MFIVTKSERPNPAPTPPTPVALLPRLRAEAESLRTREALLVQEAEQLEAEIAPARAALAAIRTELGERLQERSPMAALKALKTREADAALELDAATALASARRTAVEGAARRLQQAQDDLKRAEEGARFLHARLKAQTTRTRQVREAIEQDEAAVLHRRTLLAQEERQLAVFERELAEHVGEGSGVG